MRNHLKGNMELNSFLYKATSSGKKSMSPNKLAGAQPPPPNQSNYVFPVTLNY